MDPDQRSRSLIVHVWVERDHPDALRARVTEVSGDADDDTYASTIAATIDTVSATVRAWVVDLVGH
jgi:hypothetical protein